EPVGWHHSLHDADAESLGGRNARGGEDQLQRLAATDQTRQPLRSPAARDDGEVHLGETEARVLARDPDVAGERQLEAATEAVAADGRDNWLPAAIHGLPEVQALARFAELRGRARLHELADVRAGGERLLARAGHDDTPDVLARGERIE